MPNKYIEQKERYFIDSEKLLVDNLEATSEAIYRNILVLLNDFDTEGGRFVYNDRNVRLINNLAARIQEAVQDSEYRGRVLSYLRSFNGLNEINYNLQASLNNIDIGALQLTNIQQQAHRAVIHNLLEQGMYTNLAQPVSNMLAQSIYSNQTVTELKNLIRQFVVRTDAEVIGQVNVGQIARDALMQYDGTIQTIIFNEFDLDGWGYQGSLIKDSRPQCRRWVAMEFIPKDELEIEIQWAENNGSGLIPDTTPENFGIVRGGYNCRHTATPLRRKS